jgi:mannitol 2-dehydrogenase
MTASDNLVRLRTETLSELSGRLSTPSYDRGSVSVGIVHFGVGGFHRSHQAMYVDRLMEKGLALDWGICGVGLMPGDEAMHDALAPQDWLYTLVTREGPGRLEARVIGSIVDHIYAPNNPERVLEVLTSPGTRVVSLTVTEGGYNIDPVSGTFDTQNPLVQADAVPGATPRTMFGFIVEALRRRRASGLAPFTVMSCDNVQSNGHIARTSITAFAALNDLELAEWIGREVAFPSSMVDRITPITTPEDIAQLQEEFGVDDAWPVICEPFTQWVLEDTFVAGRPLLEEAGVQLTDHVEPYELMKLRLLNASHQALAYSGSLAGYVYVHDASSDPVFEEFLLGYMNDEARPTLPDVPGIDLDEYARTLIGRFNNSAIRDTLARLCAYSSDRIPKWVLPVIRANLASGREIVRAVAIVASWARYAEGFDEHGRPIEVQDTLRDDLMARAREQSDDPLAFVRNRQLFGDLVDHPVFARHYEDCLKSFHSVGARRTLENLNSSLRHRPG